MGSLQGRLAREHRTLVRMAEIYCRDHHGLPSGALCADCAGLMDYAELRLQKCLYGPAKPTCAKCPIHCYKRDPREQVREIMRYAGPRMTLRHPWLTLLHFADKLRRAPDPMEQRRRRSGSGNPG